MEENYEDVDLEENKFSQYFEDDLCRACLSDQKLLPLFIEQDGCFDAGNTILNIFVLCTGLEASWDDQYPKHICHNCLEELLRLNEFWKKCRESVDILNKLVQNSLKNESESKQISNDVVDDSFVVLDKKKEELEGDLPPSFEYVVVNEQNETKDIAPVAVRINKHIPRKRRYVNKRQVLKKYVKRRCPNCKIILYSREHALKHVCRRPKTNKTNTQNDESLTNDPLDDIIIDESITKTSAPGARPNRCLICKIRFINQDHALKHICRNLTPKEIVCRHCGAKFETGADKQKHILEFHKDLRPYMCEKCPRTFIYPLSLEAHRRSHNSEQPFRCTICNQSFKHRSALNTHKLDHGVEHKHSCPVCDEGFNKYSQLKHHLKQHPEIDGVFPPYLCPECGVTYTTHKSLQEHLQTIHMGTEKYACPVCNKEFKSKGYLRGHMVIHSQDNKYECQFCGKKCKTWGNRSAHIKIHHSDDRPYVCEICSKSFKFSGRLKIHLRQHNNEKPYSCTQCSMSFVSSSRLRGHMAVHGEKAVYECSLCDKKFSKKSVAVKHFAEHEEPVGMDT